MNSKAASSRRARHRSAATARSGDHGFSSGVVEGARKGLHDAFKKETASVDVAAAAREDSGQGFPLGHPSPPSTPGTGYRRNDTRTTVTAHHSPAPRRPHGRGNRPAPESAGTPANRIWGGGVRVRRGHGPLPCPKFEAAILTALPSPPPPKALHAAPTGHRAAAGHALHGRDEQPETATLPISPKQPPAELSPPRRHRRREHATTTKPPRHRRTSTPPRPLAQHGAPTNRRGPRRHSRAREEQSPAAADAAGA